MPFLVSCSLSAHRTSVAAHVSRLIVSRFQLWGRSLPGAWAGEAAGYRVPVFLPGGGLCPHPNRRRYPDALRALTPVLHAWGRSQVRVTGNIRKAQNVLGAYQSRKRSARTYRSGCTSSDSQTADGEILPAPDPQDVSSKTPVFTDSPRTKRERLQPTLVCAEPKPGGGYNRPQLPVPMRALIEHANSPLIMRTNCGHGPR